MKNMVFDAVGARGNALPVPSGLASGDAVVVGGIVGVLATDRANSAADPAVYVPGLPDGYATVWTRGTYSLEVADAVAEAGTAIYIDPADQSLGTDNTGTVLLGHTVPAIRNGVATGATKSAGAGTVNVKLGG